MNRLPKLLISIVDVCLIGWYILKTRGLPVHRAGLDPYWGLLILLGVGLIILTWVRFKDGTRVNVSGILGGSFGVFLAMLYSLDGFRYIIEIQEKSTGKGGAAIADGFAILFILFLAIPVSGILFWLSNDFEKAKTDIKRLFN